MSIDLSQFIPTFLEESFEGLEVMESSLLSLDSCDDEAINTIFRAAHSIKGGAGTFGFTAVADFTHIVETLLDAMRSGKQAVTPPLVNLLLESADCMRLLLEATRDGEECDSEAIPLVRARLEKALSGESEEPTAAAVSSPAEEEGAVEQPVVESVADDEVWQVAFEPQLHLLQSGNDPILIFQHLAEYGPLTPVCSLDALPPLEELQAEQLYLSWMLQLNSSCSVEEVQEAFEWVEDECQLEINRTAASDIVDSGNATSSVSGWEIGFDPNADLLFSGNEPLLIFHTLADLGEVQVEVNTASLPSLDELNAENVYLTWKLRLASDCSEEEVQEVFEWVEDECKLSISRFESAVTEQQAEPEIPESEQADQPAPATTATAEVAAVPKEKPKAAAQQPAAPAKAATKQPAKPAARKAQGESGSIRVDTAKIDALINRVGELVITQAMLGQVGEDLAEVEHESIERLINGLTQLERNTRDLQEDVMRVRMLPISFVFNRFPRVVHDISSALNKKVELVLSGEQTELDKTVMEKIGDPLVHLLRNSLDHGLETPDERVAAGKDETGRVFLNAYHQGGYIVIQISDDGRGLNTAKIEEKAIEKGLIDAAHNLSEQEVNELIFHAGFSTADAVSDLSGRGVGMDVVRRNIESLGGNVGVESEPGVGATFSVRLPLTLAILDGQLVRLSGNTYVVPLVSIVETILVRDEMLKPIGGSACLLRFRDDYIPLLALKELFKLPEQDEKATNPIVVVVEDAGQKVGLVVDELLGQQQTVIKSLETNFKRVEGLSGATILGDGSVALILDVTGVINRGVDADTQRTMKQSNRISGDVA